MDRGNHVSKTVLIAFSLAAGLALGGCGLFEPRDPRDEIPVTGERCRNLAEPDSLVDNTVVHYGRQTGLSCYASMIDAGFVFHPDTQDDLEAPDPNPYVGWNRDIETRVTTNVAASAVFLEVGFDGEYQTPTTTTNPRTETRYYNYHVFYRKQGQPDTTRYQGLADITFLQGTGTLWSIKEWRDQRDGSGLLTWGRLRADNRVGF